jgi:1-acyl-sn-glycerol-3-phosphate acyltransferase
MFEIPVTTQMNGSELRKVHELVLNSRQVMDAVSADPSLLATARRMVGRIVGAQRAFVIYIVSFIIRIFFPLIFPMGMHIDSDSERNLREAISQSGRLANNKETHRRPIILLPTHKSHVDYIALDLIFQEKGFPIPLIVSGDNLNMPLVGSIFHSAGAMFIRRSFAGDKLYSTVFNELMKQLLHENHILACFIEGGRSRSGKLLTPKAGFLKSVVDSVIDGHVEDALVVPIAFSYGRVVEAKSMMQEMCGGTKKKEALGDSLKSMVNLLRTTFFGAACYGSVEISVAPAFSVREHLRSRGEESLTSPSETESRIPANESTLPEPAEFDLDEISQPGTAVYRLKSSDRKMSIILDPVSEKKTRVQMALSLGFRTLHECNRVGIIQGTSLVGTVLLMHQERGLKMSDLVEKVEWLRKEIVSRGGKVQDMESVEDTVSQVVDKIMWGSGRARLVKKHKSMVMTGLFTPMETLELSTFRNNLIHLFVQDAVVAVSLYSALMRGLSPVSPLNGATPSPMNGPLMKKTASIMDVQHGAQFLSVLLKHEFIYKPMTGLSAPSPLRSPIRSAGTSDSSTRDSGIGGSTFTDNFISILGYMRERGVLEIDSGDENHHMKIGTQYQLWEFLCGLLFPFIDSYFLTLLGCYVKITTAGIDVASLVSQIQDLGETLYMGNLLDHYDAIAKDTVNNAITAFTDIGILSVAQTTDAGDRKRIATLKIPKKDVLQTIELLHSFRKAKSGNSPHQIIDAIELGQEMVIE